MVQQSNLNWYYPPTLFSSFLSQSFFMSRMLTGEGRSNLKSMALETELYTAKEQLRSQQQYDSTLLLDHGEELNKECLQIYGQSFGKTTMNSARHQG